ncbi:hypothetical protein SAMN05660733_00688 [Lentzea albidocapillata]|uniref:Uncharacterized protein n=1 Tax=Lentzea albidocapillata TaxID=40571 RepID=A0A1W2AHJ1_9PSEU|nr:hypothetical protein SAMN05660733_00688 [Lentzea albidocapillata]
MARAAGVQARVNQLVGDFRRYVEVYDRDPAFAVAQRDAHRATIATRYAAGTVRDAVGDPQFVSTLHRTLNAWGIGHRSSRLAPITEFAQALRRAEPAVTELESLHIGDDGLAADIADKLWNILESLSVVDNKAKIVAGTKTLHHLLPNLVPPMDRTWTGEFFLLHPPEWQTHQRRTFHSQKRHGTTRRRYDYLWHRLGKHLPWVATRQVSTHCIHPTLTWVERYFGYAVARALRQERRRHHDHLRPSHHRRSRHGTRLAHERRTPAGRRQPFVRMTRLVCTNAVIGARDADAKPSTRLEGQPPICPDTTGWTWCTVPAAEEVKTTPRSTSRSRRSSTLSTSRSGRA